MAYYVSIDANNRIVDVYGSPDVDPGIQKHEITDAEFRMISSTACVGDYTLVDGRVYKTSESTLRDAIAEISAAVDAMLNAAARRSGYENIHTASLRAAIPDSPYHAEGLLFAAWMDQCYAKCYELIEQYKAGAFESITAEEVIAQLPEAPDVMPKPSI